jgi:hypothetical protein
MTKVAMMKMPTPTPVPTRTITPAPSQGEYTRLVLGRPSHQGHLGLSSLRGKTLLRLSWVRLPSTWPRFRRSSPILYPVSEPAPGTAAACEAHSAAPPPSSAPSPVKLASRPLQSGPGLHSASKWPISTDGQAVPATSPTTCWNRPWPQETPEETPEQSPLQEVTPEKRDIWSLRYCFLARAGQQFSI